MTTDHRTFNLKQIRGICIHNTMQYPVSVTACHMTAEPEQVLTVENTLVHAGCCSKAALCAQLSALAHHRQTGRQQRAAPTSSAPRVPAK